MGIIAAVQLWGLASEALLALTHIKVLLCIGKPLPERTLASKRWTYFLYDLISPWMGLALALTPGMAAAAQQSIVQAACSSADSSAAAATQQVCAAVEPGMWDTALSCLRLLPAASAAQVLMHAAVDASAAGVAAVMASPLLTALVLLLCGHAALHVYYIATWNQQHARRVVKMSACEGVDQRLKSFGHLEALWFHIGTGYDILSHILLGAVLAQALFGGGIPFDGSRASAIVADFRQAGVAVGDIASALLPLY